jgi:hypothetical protein
MHAGQMHGEGAVHESDFRRVESVRAVLAIASDLLSAIDSVRNRVLTLYAWQRRETAQLVSELRTHPTGKGWVRDQDQAMSALSV